MENRCQSREDLGKISTYLKKEKKILLIITVSGIVYNAGMIAAPWYEGQLAQMLNDVFIGKNTYADMVYLALFYVAAIALVQVTRFIKRLYVRKFANSINRNMKKVIYRNLVNRRRAELESEGLGNLMTKAIADVDTCVEGIRKFTTEIFDTGVVMIAYIFMLISYDVRLALISLIFPPLAYVIAERLKKRVARSASEYKESAGRLNSAAMDRIGNAITYRVYGRDEDQNNIYECALSDYEKKAVRSNIWETSMQPIYQIISMLSVVFIIWQGAANVLNTGWGVWNIAAFTTFLSCFTRLAVKSSKAAKLFNSIQKAKVSWSRIRPYMTYVSTDEYRLVTSVRELNIKNMSYDYGTGDNVIKDVSIVAHSGDFIGVTGSVASGKSTFGKAFLGEYPYGGSILIDNRELRDVYRVESLISYMGHDTELLSGTIEENILLGKKGDVYPYLKAVCMDEEVANMRDGIHTVIGNGGVRLSGGQKARIALARTLYHRRAIIILDDPFAAVDRETELSIYKNLRDMARDSIVILISHRLTIFKQLDIVMLMEGKSNIVSTHERLLEDSSLYAELYNMQTGGMSDEV